MSEKNNGGAAFPFQPKGPNGEPWSPEYGMTLRDYFAGQALAGIMANNEYLLGAKKVSNADKTTSMKLVAQSAYEFADAMLKERDR